MFTNFSNLWGTTTTTMADLVPLRRFTKAHRTSPSPQRSRVAVQAATPLALGSGAAAAAAERGARRAL